MRALVADDDPVAATLISQALLAWGFDVVVAHDGHTAWEHITSDPGPSIAVLDWEMPGLDGPAICRRLRSEPSRAHLYVLLITVRGGRHDIVTGLGAGADDYVVKPVDLNELRARIQVGERVVTLQNRLTEKVNQLESSLARTKQPKGALAVFDPDGFSAYAAREVLPPRPASPAPQQVWPRR
jgi:DNA-binding response OmpR family regulator